MRDQHRYRPEEQGCRGRAHPPPMIIPGRTAPIWSFTSAPPNRSFTSAPSPIGHSGAPPGEPGISSVGPGPRTRQHREVPDPRFAGPERPGDGAGCAIPVAIPERTAPNRSFTSAPPPLVIPGRRQAHPESRRSAPVRGLGSIGRFRIHASLVRNDQERGEEEPHRVLPPRGAPSPMDHSSSTRSSAGSRRL